MHELPSIPYAYDALEPFIDARTMEIHHSKHHQTYVTKLNESLKDYVEFGTHDISSLLKMYETLPVSLQSAVRNFGGGHANHTFFWHIMKKDGGGEPYGMLKEALRQEFGDVEQFIQAFTKTAVGHFGSGWAWLVQDLHQKIKIISLPNQDSPLMQGLIPVIGLDVWEHAYYLKYQNRRQEYVEQWWHVVDWEKAEENFLNH